jgi:hypothetical protein
MERRIVPFSRSSGLARGGLLAAFAISITAAAGPPGALAASNHAVIDHPTFADAGSLDLNGTADVVTSVGRTKQKVLRLTTGGFRQAGSAWATEKVDVTRSFGTTFKVYLHHGAPGADGIAFLVQTVGPRALGGWGGGLGYRGIRDSVAVEFDTFQNTPDPSSNHLAVVLGGNPDRHLALAESSVPLFGRPFVARVEYDAPAKNLKVYVKSLKALAVEQLMLDQTVDLTASVGADSAWLGFTGATGSDVSKQDIYSWTVSAPGA